MSNLKLATPWSSYYREIKALFQEDPDVSNIEYDNDNLIIKIYVDDLDKAEALTKVLPNRKTFGNVELKILVIPGNNIEEESRVNIIKKAFDKNPVVEDIVSITNPMAPNFSYVVFRPEVIQYYNDDLSDVNGKRSCLFEDIAKEVIGQEDGVYFCTRAVGEPIR